MDTLPGLVFHPDYDIRLGGIEKWHPFDSCKYGRAWNVLQQRYGRQLTPLHCIPEQPISEQSLARVHSSGYLQSLKKSKNIAKALELPWLRFFPSALLNKAIVNPMRYAAAGTLLASQYALQHGVAINLSGGYHHASSNRGEGFCLFADVAIALAELVEQGMLTALDKILLIDLDAHQGNGNENLFRDQDQVAIFDMYNKDIYPADVYARERIDVDVPVVSGTSDEVYLTLLHEHLPRFLNQAASQDQAPALAFYIAGTDILAKDPLGALNVSSKGVLQRDCYVFESLLSRSIPFVMLPSGGYTSSSYRLIADSVSYLLQRVGGIQPLH